ncbi:MAG: hypothetical protein FD148_2066 [Methylocystaceae bacterium]|nr:MAG: hypothetical protein FD148_2066 [Methylocystaceae bacterium]
MRPERLRSDVVQIASLAAPGQRRGFKNAPSSAVNRPTGVCSKRHGCWPGANGPRQARGELKESAPEVKILKKSPTYGHQNGNPSS